MTPWLTKPISPAVLPAPPLPADDIAIGPPVPVSQACANCLAPLFGPFCSECGAPRAEDRPLTVRRFLDDAWGELTSVDSTTLRTARSFVLRPGELTRAYLDGRTRWYLSPMRVFLIAFGIYVFGQSLLPSSWEAQAREMEVRARTELEQGASAAERKARVAAASATGANVHAAHRRAILEDFPRAMSVGIASAARNPWFQLTIIAPWALLLARLYRAKRRTYAEHVVMALHLFAANALLLLANAALHWAIGREYGGVSSMLLQWAGIGTYFYLSALRVHDESTRRTAAKAVLFVGGAQAAMLAVPLTAIFLSIAYLAVQLLRA